MRSYLRRRRIFGGRRATPAAFLSHVLYRAKASDWDGLQVVGEGMTLAVTGTAPTIVDGRVALNGGMLSATVDFDLTGSTVILVQKSGVTDNAADSILSMTGGLGSISLEAQAVGAMYGRLRSVAAYGFASTLIKPDDGRNVSHSDVGILTTNVLSVGATETLVASGQYDFDVSTSTNIARPITTLRIARAATTNYSPVEFAEIIVLDTTDRAVVRSAVDYTRAEYGADAPHITPIFGRVAAVAMDSIAAGASAVTVGGVPQAWANLVALELGFAVPSSPQNYTLAFAGAQYSPTGIDPGTDAARYAACGTVMSANAANFTGASVVFVYGGTNDFDYGSGNPGIPIGTAADTTDATFYGAVKITIANLLANMPAGVKAFFVTLAPRPGLPVNGSGKTPEDYSDVIRACVAAAASDRIVLVDIAGAGITSDDLAGDLLHPINSGHRKIADAIKAKVLVSY